MWDEHKLINLFQVAPLPLIQREVGKEGKLSPLQRVGAQSFRRLTLGLEGTHSSSLGEKSHCTMLITACGGGMGFSGDNV